MTRRDTNFIDEIIVHYTQTPIGREVSVEEVTKWHQQRSMDTIGYHFLIHLDGSISLGRPLNIRGAHCYGRNLKSIGIAYVGGTAEGGQDTRTEAQTCSLNNLIGSLVTVFPNIKKISGHNDYSEKECPGFNVREEFKHFIDA